MNDKTLNLQDLLYSFTVLYERLSADKLELTKQVTKTDQLVKEFALGLNELKWATKEMKNNFPQRLREIGFNISKEVSSEVTSTVKQTIEHEVKATVLELQTANSEAREELNKWRSQAKSSVIGGVVIAIVGAFLASVITVKALLPAPTLNLTHEQASFLTGGQIMARIYPQLTDKEKEHLSQLIAIGAQDLVQGEELQEMPNAGADEAGKV